MENNQILSKESKNELLNSIFLSINYWFQEKNFGNCNEIITILEQCSLDSVYKKEVVNIKNKLISFGKQKETETKIPENLTEDNKIVWATARTILLYFNSYNSYDIGFNVLMELTQSSDDVYKLVIQSMKNNPSNIIVIEWLLYHFLMAVDIFEDEINLDVLGYTVKKRADRYIVKKNETKEDDIDFTKAIQEMREKYND